MGELSVIALIWFPVTSTTVPISIAKNVVKREFPKRGSSLIESKSCGSRMILISLLFRGRGVPDLSVTLLEELGPARMVIPGKLISDTLMGSLKEMSRAPSSRSRKKLRSCGGVWSL